MKHPINFKELRNSVIQNKAEQLLKDFYHPLSLHQIEPLEDVEELVNWVGYTLHYGDLEVLCGSPGLLGCVRLAENEIWVHHKLDPFEEQTEGRHNHTIAHEIGHHVLHRNAQERHNAQYSLFETIDSTIFCRTHEKKERQERQADYFAGALLMPEVLMRKRFEVVRQDLRLAYEDADFEYQISKVLKGIFHVSRQSMVIRLKQLSLLEKPQGQQLLLL